MVEEIIKSDGCNFALTWSTLQQKDISCLFSHVTEPTQQSGRRLANGAILVGVLHAQLAERQQSRVLGNTNQKKGTYTYIYSPWQHQHPPVLCPGMFGLGSLGPKK